MKQAILSSVAFLALLLFSCDTKNGSSGTGKGTSTADADTRIRESVQAWAEAFEKKDYNKAINLFDTTADDIMLIGSDSSELFSGKDQIATFLKTLLTQSFSLSWKMEKINVSRNGNTAWAFVNGPLFINVAGAVTRVPYRFTVVLKEKDKEWKWILYHGSEPKPQ